MIRHSISAALVFTGLVLAASSFSLRAELKPEDLYATVSPAIITLDVENLAGKHFIGSAFVAAGNQHAVTAWHVVHDAKRIEARFSDNQRAMVTGIVDKNERLDLAVLELPLNNRPRVKVASSPPRIGSRIYLIGSPRGLDFSISEGLISQIRTMDGVRYYQLSCPISPGDSGGPVLNEQGEAIGVVSWRKADAENVGFAIPSSEIANLNTSLAAVPLAKAVVAAQPMREISETAPRVRTPATGELPNTNDFRAFQAFLARHPGQVVTVRVETPDKEESCFTFPVVKEAAK